MDDMLRDGRLRSGPGSQSADDSPPSVPSLAGPPSPPTNQRQLPATRRNNAAFKKDGGSRLSKNKTSMAGGDSRMCIPEAISAVLPESMKRIAWEEMLLVTKTGRDFCLLDLVPSLKPLGVRVKRVTSRYMRKGGGPLHLLQSTKKEKCKLLIQVQMVDLEGDVLRHCVAFDGRVIYDTPSDVQVNLTWDRETKDSCDRVFGKLFPEEEFQRWQIIGVFEVSTTNI